MKKNIVIFGASLRGKQALEYYGKDNVLYFCDNDYEKMGTFFEDKEVICIHKLYRIKENVQIIIASAYKNEIIKQLKDNGIFNFIVFKLESEKRNKLNDSIKDNLEFIKIAKLFNKKSVIDMKNKIKIRFLFQRSIKWKAFESVYYEFLDDKRFDTKIIAIPYYGKEDCSVLIDNGVSYIHHIEYNIMQDMPDVIFYNDVDDMSRPIEYNSVKVSQIFKIVYIEGTLHNLTLKTNWIKDQIKSPIFDNSWKTIISDKEYYEMCMKESFNKSNKVFLTNPRWDNIYLSINKNIKYEQEWEKKIQDKKVVLWNPHFYINNENSSTFDIWLPYMLKTFMVNSQYALIIRPHPYLFNSIVENKIWSSKELEEFENLIKYSENIILDKYVDYAKAFSISDALITDLSTFLLTYLPTEKPILYLQHPNCEEVTNKSDFSNYYIAQKEEEIDKFLDLVITNNDYLYEDRMNLINRKIGILDGKAGKKIKEYISTEFSSCMEEV